MTKENEHLLFGVGIIAVAIFVFFKLKGSPQSQQQPLTTSPAATVAPSYPAASSVPQGYQPENLNVPPVNLTYNVPQSDVMGQPQIPLNIVNAQPPQAAGSGCGCGCNNGSSPITYGQLLSQFDPQFLQDEYNNTISTGVLQ